MMVSVGTVVGIVVAAGAAIGLYALYSNRGQIGGALSRGIESSITNPVGDYFENLFKPAADGAETPAITAPAPTPAVNPLTIADPLPPAYAPDTYQELPAEEAKQIEATYAEKEETAAAARLAFVGQTDARESILAQAEKIAAGSPTPRTTTAQTVSDILRASIGGVNPNTNQFYDLYFQGVQRQNEIPLSVEAADYYRNLGYSVRTADGV